VPTSIVERHIPLHNTSLRARITGPDGAPTILVLGGISANSDVCDPTSGWWRDLIGPGKGLDTATTRILSFDFLDHPGVSPADQAYAALHVLDAFGIEQLDAFLGASYGGMIALHFGALFPQRTKRLIVACAAHKPHPMATAWRSIQRQIVELGLHTGQDQTGLALARQLGMTTYRTPEEFAQRFDQASVQEYLHSRGQAYTSRISPGRYLALSNSIDLHHVEPASITVPTTLIAYRQDRLVPLSDVQQLQQKLPHGKLFVFDSVYGHDAFLKETVHFQDVLQQTLHAPAPIPTTAPKTQTHQPSTIAARAGVQSDTTHGAVMPPIYLSSNYTFDGFQGKRQYDYTRSGNPTRDQVGQAIADLEGGHAGVITSSGMAALDLLFYHLKPGDLVFAPHDCYGGTYRLLKHKAERGYFRVRFVDQTDLHALTQAFAQEPPRLILIETPSNPLLRLTDIRAVCSLARHHHTLAAADNTFLSPVFQRPLELGADVVLHSTTKYLNGHSDVVGGALISKTAEHHEFFSWWANCIGNTGAPFDSYLTLRGLRTLEVRLKAQEAGATLIARALEQHAAVSRVHYPGLETHPNHTLARRQQNGFGAMVSFELSGGERETRTFLQHLQLFSLAESLGGVESLVAHPATMTHASMDPAARQAAGISDQLLRLSVGLESPRDLLHDVANALGQCTPALRKPA
jgi:cystathionine gamma-synthase